MRECACCVSFSVTDTVILKEIAVSLLTVFDSKVIFTTLIPPSCEHGWPFHLLVHPLSSPDSVLRVSLWIFSLS